jgi:hypothetical protein
MRILPGLVISLGLLLSGCGQGEPVGSGTGGSGGTTNGGTGSVGATGLPLYVLLGGSSKPAGADIFLDPRLRAGEVFIIPKDPLLTSHAYTVAVNLSTGTESYTHTWIFTTGASNLMTSQSTPLNELNTLRAQSSTATAFATHPGYIISSTKHAGYQSEINTLTHFEPPPNTQRFYVNDDFGLRINAGCTNAGDVGAFGWGSGVNEIGEDIASNGDVPAIAGLWNTVYHRLPMMRPDFFTLGVADRSNAYNDPLNQSPYSQVITTSTPAFLTIDFGGDSATAQIAAHWPADNQSNVYYLFNSDTEGPDPVSHLNTNGTPDDALVGVPIHVILPTTHPFTSLTITVTP